jgi:hypothetical protein
VSNQRTCQKHGKPFPCGKCRIESAQKPPQVPPTAQFEALFKPTKIASIEPTSVPTFSEAFDDGPELPEEPDIIPNIVLVHNCLYPEVKNCRCRKKVAYGDALKMIRYGEAEWVRLVSPVGPARIYPALTVNAHDEVKRPRTIGVREIEAVVGISGRGSEQESAAQRALTLKTKGKDIGGSIQKTTRTRLSNDGTRLMEETTASFDESSFPKMTGNTGGLSKTLDKTGGQRPVSDRYDEESMP